MSNTPKDRDEAKREFMKSRQPILGNDGWLLRTGFDAGYDAGHAANLTFEAGQRKECIRILEAIIDEPELPGDMPDAMWNAIKSIVLSGDREGMRELLRLTVHTTKTGIKERYINGLNTKGDTE